MQIWTAIFLVTNAIYWTVFFYLLSRRRWNAAALVVGVFHMLLASVLSVAPFQTLLDSDYRWQLGYVDVAGRVAVIPALITLAWTLAAAWITVIKGKGNWMWLIAIGDVLFALNLGAAIVLFPLQGNLAYQRIQLGESFILSGTIASLILLLCFVVPPMWIGLWAARRARSAT